MYEKLIEKMRCCSDQYRCGDCRFVEDCAGEEYLLDEAADAIEQLCGLAVSQSKDCSEAVAKYLELWAKQPRWIPVTERLPKERQNPNTKDFEYVLCATIWGDVRPFKFGSMIGFEEPHFWHGSGSMDEYVTHWMPMPSAPEPPKEEA